MRNLSVIKGLYQGNGVTRRFAIPFEYNDTAQIFVTITTFDEGDYTYRVLDSTEYTIDEDSVEIVYPKTDDDEPIPSTQYLTVWRDTDLLQLMDLTNQGAAWPDSIEASLDKLHQIVQELAEGLSRSLKVDIGDPQTPDEKLVAIQDYVLAAAESSRSASASEASAQRAAEAAATSEANAAESERLASGYADTATDAASRAEDSAISARAYNAPDYDNETTYQAGDVVTYTDGNSYRALQETTGNEPPNIIYWQKVTDYVGDNFFEIDEYGYIVPMDSPSHSRYWRVDQNGYIVPIDGGDGGYRPDTRSLSAEYLNVTNEGYVKHLRADDVNAQDLSATGNVTAGMVTTPQANITTLTANAVNAQSASVTEISAGTLTANDIIAKGPVVDVRAFGAVGDGVHDDTAAIENALIAGAGRIVLFPVNHTFCMSNPVIVYSNTEIIINGNINVLPNEFGRFNLFKAGVETPGYTGMHDIFIHGNGIIDCNTGGTILNDGPFFRIFHCRNIKITDVTIKNWGGHAIEVGGVDGCIIKNVKFLGCKVRSESLDVTALQIEYIHEGGTPRALPYDGTITKNMTVEDCVFDIGDAGTELRVCIGSHTEATPNNDFYENITIRNCTFKNQWLNGAGEIVEPKWLYAIPLSNDYKNVKIEGNTFINVKYAVYINTSSDVYVMNNKLLDTAYAFGVYNSSDIHIDNNYFDTTVIATRIAGATNIYFENNCIYNWGEGNSSTSVNAYPCVFLENSPSSSEYYIRGNVITLSHQYAALVYHMSDSNVANVKTLIFDNNIIRGKSILASGNAQNEFWYNLKKMFKKDQYQYLQHSTFIDSGTSSPSDNTIYYYGLGNNRW